ncbi:MAG: hypothetical protein Unbinned4118contig1001_35 [Prokaryotic dsDNA virus sp.]|jgi:hypothetical protein|nr:MAG: hypothetical protein Unbinned4118contig1001_35 [Prokaryotic dsDNA virus sp.]|tara:strand:+ start:2446 stop:2700 length:255 start_codon:yes stop_codon:yes gene_type:complete
MVDMLGAIIDALAVIGAAGVIAFAGFVWKKLQGSKQKTLTPSQPASEVRNIVINHGQDNQDQIDSALESDDAAGRLAQLGNKRR